jgi:aspartate/methionine/tyrosine aminotransferase
LLDISEDRRTSEQHLSLTTAKLHQNDSGNGHVELRNNLAALYSARSGAVTSEDIIITNGGQAAIYTALSALVSSGDHIICQSPIDGFFFNTCVSLGAEVVRWTAEPGKKWRLDLEELKSLIKDNTKLIIIQNPCDPTGAIVSRPLLETMLELAEEKGVVLLADESYRPLFHSITPSDDDFPPAAINLGFKKVVVTGTVENVYGLAGVRAGWLVTTDKAILGACKKARRSKALAASTLDELVAAEAISDSCIHALLAKNIKLCQTNLDLLQSFIEEHSWGCSWIKPQAGNMALLKFHKMGKPVDSRAFCTLLVEKASILLCPVSEGFGGSQDLRGYVRVAFGGKTEDIKFALSAWKMFMEGHFEAVPTASSKP